MTWNDLDARIGERIRRQRKRIGLSQKELAGRLDIVFQQLQKHESGTSRVPASRLYEIAKALNTPISHFFDCDNHAATQGGSQFSDISAILGTKKGILGKQVLELVTAFIKIKDEGARADIVSLVAKLAKPSAKR
ncbi:helix-turn-helix domain-containing protein [Bradyrhizobium sp. DASA03007]|uniref:helix-turn-helix domain-containing protein n=1 Tax=unclassified Bradyrhizobium TaxID=2631580 RepID=UPI003F6F1C9B